MNELYAHQKDILHLLAAHKRFAVFAEQGTGKTLPMLTHILGLYKSGRISSALIVCPKAVRGSWERDIEKFFEPFEQVLIKRCLTVTTYDLIWRRAEYDRHWDFVCLDESHFIKNRTGNRYAGQMKTVGGKRVRASKGIKQISSDSEYRYILTGTPVGNSRWEEIWAQYDFLDPSALGKYSEFEGRYCILNQYFKPWRYRNIDELKAKIYPLAYRVTKAECLDLPDKLPPERFSLELADKKLYREMLKNYIEEFDIEAKNPLARMTKLRQMCSGSVPDDEGNAHPVKCEKLSALGEFLSAWEKKLVIFAEFRRSIADIRGLLIKRKIKHVVLDGEQKDKTIWREFQSDPAIQIIICQYRTASAGIDLFAADTMLFYEPTLSSQVFEQACDRIHRPGQNSKCSYILFETGGTVEVKIWDALMGHRDFNETELAGFIQSNR